MGRVRIRWRALAKVAVITIGGTVALQALPGLLKPPAPPALARDVGLRGITVERSRPQPSSPLPPDVISSVPHRHPKPKKVEKSLRPPTVSTPTAPPAPESPPPEPPPPAPVEPPPPPPPPPPAVPDPPADGSEEFAPH